MAWGVFLWTGCNSSDATAPLSTHTPARPSPAPNPPATPATPAGELTVARLIAPDTLRPGAVLIIEGTGFATGPLDNEVSIGSATATAHAHVVVATPTRLEVRLPDPVAFPCMATGSQNLRITSAARTVTRPVTVAVARRLDLAAGASANLLDPASVRCTELVGTSAGARFAVAVLNTSRTSASSNGVLVRAAQTASTGAPMIAASASAGTTTGASASDRIAAAVPARPGVLSSGAAVGFSNSALRLPENLAPHNEDAEHANHLRREAARLSRAGSATALWSAARARRAASADLAAVVAPLVEQQLVQRNAMYSSCSASARITARVVYAGAHSVVLEDVASPRARGMDEVLRALGKEFDEVMYPLLVSSVGDPLALNASMRGDGRITMLFSPFVNDSATSTTGYVTACNLYPQSNQTHSNEEALFYARVPRANETVAAWRRTMRSTVMHEAKHLASFAERLARGASFEEPWMEEATARIAEELYARTFSGGGTWRANTGWVGSLQCEVYQCDDRPLTMWKHFPVLHDYFAGVESFSPLGGASNADVTFYASGWSLVRWALDHYATDEGTFVRDLVRGVSSASGSTHAGLDALSAITGRPADELLAEWSLANLLDDRPGFIPERATLSFPGWHLPQMMAGLSAMNGARYRAHPFTVRDITGDQQLIVPQLRGYTASFLETSVAPDAAQLLELRGATGGAVSSAIRLAIVRVH